MWNKMILATLNKRGNKIGKLDVKRFKWIKHLFFPERKKLRYIITYKKLFCCIDARFIK